MLVLTRKMLQEIEVEIPPSTETRTMRIRVNETRVDRVRLAFDAPEEIRILRTELVEEPIAA